MHKKKIPWGYKDNNDIPLEEYQNNHIDTNYLTGEEEIYHFNKLDENLFFDNLYDEHFFNI